MVKVWNVTLTFATKDGVRIQRTVALRDSFRANAEARATANAVPAGATLLAVAGKVAR